ncbi:FkbM family methyltransferase [Laspinema olomoucense]|uniref:FkbM family methyltransferase n=1 Tax=Laspinema olomoucense D3b TaxID=2953688 RepID=A0ABT2NCW0_9CYAN|nr:MULTISPECIES: FkbM family methyltransferase [unclassified Laspinema]MCT7980529.1 FkbM family methyltransferase [Laspinema sp. D3b]
MENSSFYTNYWEYVNQVCPNIKAESLSNPDIEASIKKTSWEDPTSARELNNIAVLALIEAEQCEDSSLKEMYVEIAFESLVQGTEMEGDDPLCAAHLALLFTLNGEVDAAIPLALSTFDEAMQAAYVDLKTISPNIVYCPSPLSVNFRRDERLSEILQCNNGYIQALWLLEKVIERLEIESIGRRDVVIIYTKKRIDLLGIGVQKLLFYIWEKINFERELFLNTKSLFLVNKLQEKVPFFFCPELIQTLYLILRDAQEIEAAKFWQNLSGFITGYNIDSLELKWTHLPIESPFTYLPFETKLLLAAEPTGRSIVTSILIAQGDWFEKEMEFWRSQIKPGMTVIDVGANVGVYTFSAANQVGSEGRVLAIEPFAGCIQCLEETCRVNNLSSVTICAGAASDRNGTVRLSLNESSELNEIVAENTGEEIETGSYQEVACFTLDSLSERENLTQVDFMKIDAEGHELAVLVGSARILSEFAPVILYENIAGVTGSNLPVASYLNSRGYKLFLYRPYLPELVPIIAEDDYPDHLNIIAVPECKVNQFYNVNSVNS